MKIWEPKPPGTLWVTSGLLRDCFTFTMPREGPQRHRKKKLRIWIIDNYVLTDGNGLRKLAGLFLFAFQSDIQGIFLSTCVSYYDRTRYISNHAVLALIRW